MRRVLTLVAAAVMLAGTGLSSVAVGHLSSETTIVKNAAEANNLTTLVAADIEASNGVIRAIDTVIIPGTRETKTAPGRVARSGSFGGKRCTPSKLAVILHRDASIASLPLGFATGITHRSPKMPIRDCRRVIERCPGQMGHD